MTVREWFRLLRAVHRPEMREETECLWALRNQEWREAEFWLLLLASKLYRASGQHAWRATEYTWECRWCGASHPREIDEETPPDPDPECLCRACRPCTGVS